MSKKHPGGRPTDYTPEKAAMICYLLASPMTLTKICQRDDMPHQSTVFRWLAKHEEFREQYAQAREIQSHIYADEIVDIADDSSGDVLCDEYGNQKQNHEFVQRSKLRIDARKWHASKTNPSKYGDKTEIQAVVGQMPPPEDVDPIEAIEHIKGITRE